ncbi:MAG: hypothetical protein WC919_01010 [Candidatus Paceibacterota bacterium]|jgi:hypothetical protein
MKPSEIKVGGIYRCVNGTYRGVIFFWPAKKENNYEASELSYIKLTRERKTGRFIRKKWMDGICTIKHFARYSTRRVK